MIKVLQVLEATVGGTRQHLVSLVAGLDKTAFSVEVAAPSIRQGTINDTKFTEEILALDIRFHIVEMKREIHLWHDLKALWTLFQIIRREKYDIVHVHSSKAGFLGRIAAKSLGVTTVYTANGFYFLSNMKQAKARFYLFLERLAGHLTDRLIAVSASEQEQVVAYRVVPTQKVVVIPNAIDTQYFQYNKSSRHQIRTELGIADDVLVVGTIARFIEQKDPATFIRAAAQILQVLPNTHFVWCGEGPLRDEIELLAAELGIHAAIHFLGYRHDIVNVMNAFDIFALTSIFEGLPYTILEAMSIRLPLVMTDVVGNRDVVVNGHNGWLVPPQNPQAVAEAILNLLQNSDKRLAMGQAGHQLVKEQYSLEAMIKNTQALYYDLVANGRA